MILWKICNRRSSTIEHHQKKDILNRNRKPCVMIFLCTHRSLTSSTSIVLYFFLLLSSLHYYVFFISLEIIEYEYICPCYCFQFLFIIVKVYVIEPANKEVKVHLNNIDTSFKTFLKSKESANAEETIKY